LSPQAHLVTCVHSTQVFLMLYDRIVKYLGRKNRAKRNIILSRLPYENDWLDTATSAKYKDQPVGCKIRCSKKRVQKDCTWSTASQQKCKKPLAWVRPWWRYWGNSVLWMAHAAHRHGETITLGRWAPRHWHQKQVRLAVLLQNRWTMYSAFPWVGNGKLLFFDLQWESL